MVRAAGPVRFIPAGAGNSMSFTGTIPPAPVHPRRRGEQARPLEFSERGGGSSPQARGTEQWARLPKTQARFIPAGAGNS